MGTRTDSTTTLLNNMFLNCKASPTTIAHYAETKHKMCNSCKVIEKNETDATFAFEFDSETLMYQFDFINTPMNGSPLVKKITFLGFCE